MELRTQIACGHCGKSHRIHRSLNQGRRYRFICKGCNAVVLFSTQSVRWELESDVADLRSPYDTMVDEPCRSMPPPPSARAISPHRDPARDTIADASPPVHLSPLVRRGVEMPREPSRVRWLRQGVGLQRRAT